MFGAVNTFLAILLFLSTVTLLVLAWISGRKHRVTGALMFALLCLASSFYTAGYAMELLSARVADVDVWSKVQYIGLPFLPAFFVALSIEMNGLWKQHGKLFRTALFGIPSLTLLFRLISGIVPLQYGHMAMESNGFFPILVFSKGPWYYVHFLYLGACGIYAMTLHVMAFRKEIGHLRQQTIVLAIASVMPILSVLLNVFGLFPLRLDSGPFFVLFNYLIFFWCIFRHDFLHLVPLARNKVFDWIQDGAIVLDLKLEIRDFNRSAAVCIPELARDGGAERTSTQSDFDRSFARVPAIRDAIHAWRRRISEEARRTVTGLTLAVPFELPDEDGVIRHYEAKISELGDHGQLVGIVLLIGDVTKRVELMRQLEQEARIDALTGLNNRNSFLIGLKNLCEGVPVEGPFSLLMLDIDHFKGINDRFGHPAGDEVLRRLAAILAENTRASDVLGRYGGEEFLVFMPGATSDRAVQVAERLRLAVEANAMTWEGEGIRVTISIGVAPSLSDAMESFDRDGLIRRVDAALYEAKRKGRNRVQLG